MNIQRMYRQQPLTEAKVKRPTDIEIIPLNFEAKQVKPVMSRDTLDLHYDNKNSRVIYLMGQDNSFMQFYDLDIDVNELTE